MDIASWLRTLGFDQYATAFVENHIRPELLPSLTADDLKDLGVASVGHRRELLGAIAALRTGPAAAPEVSTPDVASGSAAERRQLTVMFCDLVGSTALSARLDPEELREVIGAYHRCVAEAVRRFDGFVAKYMGDGVLVYFGYPRAHEDDAERAVRAGLAVVEAMRGVAAADPLEVRIGIATGLVVVGDLIGEGASQEQAVVGETPNLAARLQALAEPGAVVIAAATRRLLDNLFRLRALGRQSVKGLAEPVEAWAVEAAATAEGRFEAARSGRLTDFVGREQELGLLLERWKLAQDGEGQVVLLSGEPGIGKSRILERVAQPSRGGARDQPAPALLALLRQQRVLPDHRQFRARPAVRARRHGGAEARQARSAGRRPIRQAARGCAVHRRDALDPLRGALRGDRDDAAEIQGRDLARALRHDRGDRPPSADSDAVRGHPLGRSDHPRSPGPPDPPGQEHSAPDRADPPAGVCLALVALRPRRRAHAHQADPAAEQCDGLAAGRRQGPAWGPARTNPRQDRRRAAVRRGVDQVDPRIRRPPGCRRPLGICRARRQLGDPADPARLADGAARSLYAGQGDRADRRGDRARVLLRADRRRRPASQARTGPGAGAAHRIGAGVPAGHAARRRPTRSSTRWCRTPPTTRCSDAAGRNCTAGSLG